jgi:ABC-2 type transport system permease protein
MLTLVRRSLGRVPVVFMSVVGLLAIFQIVLIAVARSLADTGNFAAIAQMVAPDFILKMFGGAFASFAGLSVLGFFDPLVMILVVQFAIFLATEPAGEVESGFLDLILARPIARHQLITRSLLVMTFGVLMATLTMGVATWVGLQALAPRDVEWPSVGTVRTLMVHLTALAWCFGCGGLACAAFVNRRAAAVATIGISAVAFYLADFVGASWHTARYAATVSPFHYFRGAEVLAGTAPTVRDLVVLISAGCSAIVVAYVKFQRRDIQ